jgi:glycosyltransferase involved in cell wall biosynthesis
VLRIAQIDEFVPHYTVGCLNAIARTLARHGAEFTYFAGTPPDGAGFHDGLDSVDRAVRVPNLYIGPAYWQHLYGQVRDHDLVIVPQANAPLLNYVLLASRRLFGKPRRIAYVGHGMNFQSHGKDGLRERWKRAMIGAVDHWFAYTQVTADIVAASGFPRERITVFNNSIDVSAMREAAAHVAAVGRPAARAKLNLGTGPTAVFCSRLSRMKRLDFLFEAVDIVKQSVPDFQLVVIGDGEDRAWVDDYASSRAWVKPVGALYGAAKCECIAACDVMVMPSAVGLSILDAFAGGLPTIAANFNNHGPEIAYLKQDVNGIITAPHPRAYAQAVMAVLTDPVRLAAMSASADESAEIYSLEHMVERFSQGILNALS